MGKKRILAMFIMMITVCLLGCAKDELLVGSDDIAHISDYEEMYLDEDNNVVEDEADIDDESTEKEEPEKVIENDEADKMSDEQKYEIVFDWMVNYFKYDYATLYSTQATNLALETNSKFGKIVRQNRSKIENYTELDDIEKAKKLGADEVLIKPIDYIIIKNIFEKLGIDKV